MIALIPAIDLIDGKCVRLRQGDFSRQTIYSDDPVLTAKAFAAAGLRRLHLVDLDGARAGKPANLEVLRAIAGATEMLVDFSGGIRSDADLQAVFDAGAAFAGIGSLAVRNPEQLRAWVSYYGARRFIIGADVRDGQIAINGWEERSDVELFPFLENMARLGLKDVFCTDVSVDGMMTGPSVQLYREVLAEFPDLRLIASGGVRNMEDVLALERIGCAGVIVGKALYEGGISLESIALKISQS